MKAKISINFETTGGGDHNILAVADYYISGAYHPGDRYNPPEYPELQIDRITAEHPITKKPIPVSFDWYDKIPTDAERDRIVDELWDEAKWCHNL